jgi:GntR family transcriptional regulator
MVSAMGTGPTDARPIQVRIADDVRMRIETGEYKPGDRLPSLDELAETHLCSLTAARRALDLLKQQGLVISTQGKGNFVRQRPSARRHGVDRYSRSRWRSGEAVLDAEAARQGLTAGQVMRELADVPAPVSVAERLRIEPGTTVFVRRRTTMINDRPNQLADSYYPLTLVERVSQIREENTGPGGGFARIEDAGILLDRISEEWSSRMPTGPETVALRLPAGTPVIDLVRTTYDIEGHPVEVMLAVIAADMVRMAYEFKIPD